MTSVEMRQAMKLSSTIKTLFRSMAISTNSHVTVSQRFKLPILPADLKPYVPAKMQIGFLHDKCSHEPGHERHEHDFLSTKQNRWTM
jgi:hypothetical protein